MNWGLGLEWERPDHLLDHISHLPLLAVVAGNFRTEALLHLASCTPLRARMLYPEWDRIVTPYQVAVWEHGLASHTDRCFAEYVCKGIREGFRIGFNYHQARHRPASGNMKSAKEHEEVVDKYIGTECEKKRLLGPLPRDEYPHVQISPFGVIPKSEPGKWRLIIDLSSPAGGSVNDGINKEWCSLTYMTIDDVAARVVRLGRGALMAKFDLKSAYRQVPVHPDDRWLLGMEWKGQLFVDTALPFGLRSAPVIFNAVAEALAHMIRQKGVEELDHYLDDFSIVGCPDSQQCREHLNMALATCEEAGCPVATEKTEGPTTVLTLLGIELDSVQLQLRLPRDKLEKLKKLVANWRKRSGCRKRELESLAGHLSHACKVVRPGRRFLRGIFGLLSCFRRRDHPIRLNASFRADLEWWHVFVSSWNGVSMMLEECLKSPSVEMWSDASGGWGCGAWCGDKWFQVKWSHYQHWADASIAVKELLPIVIATAVWGHVWRSRTVLCHCDNQAVVSSVRGGYCRDPYMAQMLRCLFYLEAKFDLTWSAVHVPGVENGPADSLSRNKMSSFFDLIPQAQANPSHVPEELVNRLVVKENWTSDIWSRWLETLPIIH